MQHTSLVPTGLLPRGTAPTGPEVGQTYFDTTLGRTRTWDGAAWVAGGSDEVHIGSQPPTDGDYSIWIDPSASRSGVAARGAEGAWRDAVPMLGEGWEPMAHDGLAAVRRIGDVVHCRFRVAGATATQPHFFVPPVGLRPDSRTRGVAVGVSLDGGVIANTLAWDRFNRVADFYADVETAFSYTTLDPPPDST